jgi:hypothetical protein
MDHVIFHSFPEVGIHIACVALSQYNLSSTNVLAVSFISYLILKRERQMRDAAATSLKYVIVVIMESAAIYWCVLVFFRKIEQLDHASASRTL